MELEKRLDYTAKLSTENGKVRQVAFQNGESFKADLTV